MITQQWFNAVQACQQQGSGYALITVLGCTGSTPRDQSSKMVITERECFDTIGGGHLEFVVTQKARELLANNESVQQVHHFPLGASLGQCCGGSATMLIETFASCAFHIGLFGAGHVAKALVTILAELPCKVTWVDSRDDLFPAHIPANVTKYVSDDPTYELEQLPANSDVLILTHSHQLDFELCIAALTRDASGSDTLRSIGLIGSNTKALRFIKRLQARSFSDELISKIRCPVGLSAVPGKLPMEVSVSIAGELIALEHQTQLATLNGSREAKKTHRGLGWKEIKQSLTSTTAKLNTDINTTGQGYVLKLKESKEI